MLIRNAGKLVSQAQLLAEVARPLLEASAPPGGSDQLPPNSKATRRQPPGAEATEPGMGYRLSPWAAGTTLVRPGSRGERGADLERRENGQRGAAGQWARKPEPGDVGNRP